MAAEKKRDIHYFTATAFRVLLSLVFIFSGFVKAVDPLGTTYKIQDYCQAFGLNFLYDYAKLLSFLLFSFEMALGLTLMLGLSKRKSAWAATLFLSAMSVLTLYLTISNPISDCGCFGDAIILTNGQTFAKNLVLLALSIIVLTYRKPLYSLYGSSTCRWAFAACLLTPFLIGHFSLRHLPLLDFRPYRIGNNLLELMEIPEGAPTDSIVMEYIFEKGVLQQRFSATDIPYKDTTWHYIRREQRVVRKGYVPPIHDFTILHPDSGDITRSVLEYPSYTFLWVSNKLETANHRPGPQLKKLEEYVNKYGYRLLVLTSSSEDMIAEWKYEYDLLTPFCSVDETTLKTVIRSNPGLILLKDGVVYNKWSARDIEAVVEKLEEPLTTSSYGEKPFRKGLPIIWGAIGISLSLLVFFYFVHLTSNMYDKYRKQTSKQNHYEKEDCSR